MKPYSNETFTLGEPQQKSKKQNQPISITGLATSVCVICSTLSIGDTGAFSHAAPKYHIVHKMQNQANASILQDYRNLIEQKECQLKTNTIQSEMLQRLEQLANELEDNWDGYGGYPMEDAAINHTREAILALSDEDLAQWNLFPCPNGTFLLASKNNKASINIGNDSFSYAAFQKDKEPLHGMSTYRTAFFLKVFNDIKPYTMEA